MLFRTESKLFALLFLLLLIPVNVFCDDSLENGIYELAQKLQLVDSNKDIPSVAVLGFTTQDGSDKFEDYVNDKFYEDLFIIGKMKLYERSNIELLLNEQKFQISGNVNDETAKSIGKLIGVDYVCYGKVIDFDRKLNITGRIVNVETGEIASISTVSIIMNNEISKMIYPDVTLISQKANDTWFKNDYKYVSVIKLGYGYGFDYSTVFKLAFSYNINKLVFVTADLTYTEVDYQDQFETHEGMTGGLIGLGLQSNSNNRFQIFSTLYLGYGSKSVWTDKTDWDNQVNTEGYDGIIAKADVGVNCHIGDTWILGLDGELGPLDILYNLYLGFKFH